MQPWSNKSETELYLEGCDSVFVGKSAFRRAIGRRIWAVMIKKWGIYFVF